MLGAWYSRAERRAARRGESEIAEKASESSFNYAKLHFYERIVGCVPHKSLKAPSEEPRAGAQEKWEPMRRKNGGEEGAAKAEERQISLNNKSFGKSSSSHDLYINRNSRKHLLLLLFGDVLPWFGIRR